MTIPCDTRIPPLRYIHVDDGYPVTTPVMRRDDKGYLHWKSGEIIDADLFDQDPGPVHPPPSQEEIDRIMRE
jgi:hypothetical protein